MVDDETMPRPAHDISHSKYVLAFWNRNISNVDAHAIVELNNRLGHMFLTEYLLDVDEKMPGCLISSYMLNALPVRENAPPNATHAEKRLGTPVKTCVLEGYSRDSFALPYDRNGAYKSVMRACSDVATMFVMGQGDAFAIVSSDHYKRDDHMGVVLLRWSKVFEVFGVSSFKEWQTKMPSNKWLDRASSLNKGPPPNSVA